MVCPMITARENGRSEERGWQFGGNCGKGGRDCEGKAWGSELCDVCIQGIRSFLAEAMTQEARVDGAQWARLGSDEGAELMGQTGRAWVYGGLWRKEGRDHMCAQQGHRGCYVQTDCRAVMTHARGDGHAIGIAPGPTQSPQWFACGIWEKDEGCVLGCWLWLQEEWRRPSTEGSYRLDSLRCLWNM